MTTLPELPRELQRHILFFSTSPYTTRRVSKLWYNLTRDTYYERLLKNLFRHRIAIEAGQSYKQKFDLVWTKHFASCFQQKQLAEQLIKIHELIEVPDANFYRNIADNAGIGYGTATKDSEYLSKISPVVTKLKELRIPFSNEDEVEKLNLYYAIEAEAYLRKYKNDLKNMDKLLIYYSGMGGLEAVKYLVLKGADPNKACIVVTDSYGGTYHHNPLQMATWLGWMPIMEYLIEECHVDINWMSCNGETVLWAATRNEGITSNMSQRIQYLLAHGLKPTEADLGLITAHIVDGGNTDYLFFYRDILNGCLDRLSKAINRSIGKNIISEEEAQKMYKDFFDNLQKLKLPAIVLQALANHPFEFQAEQNRITDKEIRLFFKEVYAVVDSQVYPSEDEEKRSESLIYDLYIPIIDNFQAAENKLLEEEAKRKRSAEEIDNGIGKEDPSSKRFKSK